MKIYIEICASSTRTDEGLVKSKWHFSTTDGQIRKSLYCSHCKIFTTFRITENEQKVLKMGGTIYRMMDRARLEKLISHASGPDKSQYQRDMEWLIAEVMGENNNDI